MTISNDNPDLFRAILAMDAYNRGYNAGIGDTLTGLSGTQLGNALLLNTPNPAGSQSASFYAQAYSWNGKTIISCRGTDVLPGVLGGNGPTWSASSWTDVLNWTQFIGFYDTPQQYLAATFYKTVRDSNLGNPIELTGHSLGGGLAGFIGSIYGRPATMFDDITFEQSVTNLLNCGDIAFNRRDFFHRNAPRPRHPRA